MALATPIFFGKQFLEQQLISMFERYIKKYVPLMAIVIIAGLAIKILYHIIFATASLADKGWIPATIFVTVTLFLVLAVLVLIMKITKPLPKRSKGTVVDVEADKDPNNAILKEKMTSQNKKEKSTKLDEHIIVSVLGTSSVGKSSIINQLIVSNTDSTSKQISIDLQEAPALSVNAEKNSQILDKYKDSRLALFIINEDLTSYEWDVLYKLIDMGLYVIITLNKMDLLLKTEVEEIEQSIIHKIQQMQDCNRCSLVKATAEPKPITVIIQEINGDEKEEERTPPVDCKSLLHNIQTYISQHSANNTVKFLKTSR